jgi:hypothetical protein
MLRYYYFDSLIFPVIKLLDAYSRVIEIGKLITEEIKLLVTGFLVALCPCALSPYVSYTSFSKLSYTALAYYDLLQNQKIS